MKEENQQVREGNDACASSLIPHPSSLSGRVLVLYNEPVLPAGHPNYESEHEILITVAAVHQALVQAGFETVPLGVQKDFRVLLAGLRDIQPDVVFNLYEGTADQGFSEAHVAGVLDWLGVPFTGSPFPALSLCRSKHLTKRIFQGAGLPTPEFFVVEQLPVPRCPLSWPVIVKPAEQDASVGLDQGSVVSNQERLNERVSLVLDTFGPPVLVEQFIPGRELTAAVIESPNLQVLPLAELLFEGLSPSSWPIYTYEGKWTPGSPDYEATARHPAALSPALAEGLNRLAQRAFRLLGCRDYARVDFRVNAAEQPYLLEVNPNPDLNPNLGLADNLAAVGITHAQFTAALVWGALRRGHQAATMKVAYRGDKMTR